jgi:hypothetical protein
MTDYGLLNGIVYAAGVTIAAGTAIGLAWTRDAKWLPPQEDLPGSTRKVSALLTGVVVVLLYVFAAEIGDKAMAIIAVVCLVVGLLALLLCVYVNTTFSYFVRRPGEQDIRVLGGHTLTPEAVKIQREHGLSGQPLFENAHFEFDLVWTRPSRGTIKVLSTTGFILLITCGSIGLASAALLLSNVAMGAPPAT